jgi:hypothetical protein
MFHVPSITTSDTFRKAVFVKENGICRKCHQHCSEHDFEIRCTVPHYKEVMHDLSRFYIIHPQCKHKVREDSINFLKELFKIYSIFYIAGIALMIYAIIFYLRREVILVNHIVGGFVIAGIGRFIWKIQMQSYIKDDGELRSYDAVRFSRLRHIRSTKYGTTGSEGRLVRVLLWIVGSIVAAGIIGMLLVANTDNITRILAP